MESEDASGGLPLLDEVDWDKFGEEAEESVVESQAEPGVEPQADAEVYCSHGMPLSGSCFMCADEISAQIAAGAPACGDGVVDRQPVGSNDGSKSSNLNAFLDFSRQYVRANGVCSNADIIHNYTLFLKENEIYDKSKVFKEYFLTRPDKLVKMWHSENACIGDDALIKIRQSKKIMQVVKSAWRILRTQLEKMLKDWIRGLTDKQTATEAELLKEAVVHFHKVKDNYEDLAGWPDHGSEIDQECLGAIVPGHIMLREWQKIKKDPSKLVTFEKSKSEKSNPAEARESNPAEARESKRQAHWYEPEWAGAYFHTSPLVPAPMKKKVDQPKAAGGCPHGHLTVYTCRVCRPQKP